MTATVHDQRTPTSSLPVIERRGQWIVSSARCRYLMDLGPVKAFAERVFDERIQPAIGDEMVVRIHPDRVAIRGPMLTSGPFFAI